MSEVVYRQRILDAEVQRRAEPGIVVHHLGDAQRQQRQGCAQHVGDAPGLADCLRITVGTPQENDEVLAAFAVLVKEEI